MHTQGGRERAGRSEELPSRRVHRFLRMGFASLAACAAARPLQAQATRFDKSPTILHGGAAGGKPEENAFAERLMRTIWQEEIGQAS